MIDHIRKNSSCISLKKNFSLGWNIKAALCAGSCGKQIEEGDQQEMVSCGSVHLAGASVFGRLLILARCFFQLLQFGFKGVYIIFHFLDHFLLLFHRLG